MVQKITALLCLAWLFASPGWVKAMDRNPNGLALLLALLALSWWWGCCRGGWAHPPQG